MIELIEGKKVQEPALWTLVFDREASTWWASWLALGCYKHVRAFAYVPFLHVWLFVDPHLRGTDITVAGSDEAGYIITAWIKEADAIDVEVERDGVRRLPIAGWCVPVIKRLIGLRSSALRPDALWRDCLRHGGKPWKRQNTSSHHSTPISSNCSVSSSRPA